MVKKLAIIREIFKGDHNAAAAARKLRRNQISALSGTLNNVCKRVTHTTMNSQNTHKIFVQYRDVYSGMHVFLSGGEIL